MRIRLQHKFLMVVTPLIVMPLLLLGWFAYDQLEQTTREKTLTQINTLLQQVNLQVQDRIRTTRANAELFSNAMLVQKYMLSDEAERYRLMQPTLLRQFASYLDAYPEYNDIRIVLPDGYVDSSLSAKGYADDRMSISEMPYFQTALTQQDTINCSFIPTPDHQGMMMLASKRIELIDRSIDPILSKTLLRGFLLITANLSFLQEQIEKSAIGKRGFLFVTDRSGRTLYSHGNELSGIHIDGSHIPAHPAPASDTQTSTLVLNGEEYLLKGYSLDEHLKLFAALPRSELRYNSSRLGMAVATVTLITILLTISMVYFAVRRHLIRPIEALSLVANEIGSGNLDITVPPGSRDELGELANAFGEMKNSLQHSHEQIRYLAYHDNVTGLPNRTMFREYLQDVLLKAKCDDREAALLFLDLDNFKRVNDTLGHQAGDELLQELARRLSKCVRQGDHLSITGKEQTPELVARLGGDEFIILLPDIQDPHTPGLVAERILEAFSTPAVIREQELHISTSIGITLYPRDGNDVATLIKHADIAMYHAKRRGKKNYQYYSSDLDESTSRQLALENKLRRAITNGNLVLHFQPQLDAASQQVIGAEALVRWQDEELGLLYPDTFIGLAEETGLIVPMGEWVLREACARCVAWHDMGYTHLSVAVNLSPIQARLPNLPALVDSILKETGLPARHLELEITESTLLDLEGDTNQTLNQLIEQGIALAIDDFGTGYSSLVYLKRFRFDKLKIDRSFVRDLENDQDDAAICAAIIAMAHKLGVRVTAEGVETPAQMQQLVDWSCDELQGYLFSKPVEDALFLDYLSSRIPRVQTRRN